MLYFTPANTPVSKWATHFNTNHIFTIHYVTKDIICLRKSKTGWKMILSVHRHCPVKQAHSSLWEKARVAGENPCKHNERLDRSIQCNTCEKSWVKRFWYKYKVVSVSEPYLLRVTHKVFALVTPHPLCCHHEHQHPEHKHHGQPYPPKCSGVFIDSTQQTLQSRPVHPCCCTDLGDTLSAHCDKEAQKDRFSTIKY